MTKYKNQMQAFKKKMKMVEELETTHGENGDSNTR